VTKSRRRAIVALSLCGAAIAAIVVLTVVLSENVVYFRTVSEAVASKRSDGDQRFRMAGKVVPGSVHSNDDGIVFDLTDGVASVRVHHHGDPPELFEDGAPVVSEGHWLGSEFDSDRLMIKHGADYRPPAVDASK